MGAEKSTLAGQHAIRLTLALLAMAACVTLYFIAKLQPSDASAFVFAAAWLTMPHAALVALLFVLQRKGKPLLPWCIVVVLVAAGGIYVLVDAIYLHPDPQSAIAVVLTPMLQGIVFLIAAPLAWWSGRRMSA